MIGKNLLILILAFVTVFSAGAVLEHVRRHVEGPEPRGSIIGYQLGLTSEQTDQMHKIFEEATSHSRETFDTRRHELMKERDDAIRALIPASDQSKLDKVQADYTAKMAQLDNDRRQVFVTAHERIKKEVLTPEQAVKFDELTKRRDEQRAQEGHHHGGPMTQPGEMGPPDMPPPGDSALPTTRPGNG